MLKMQCRERDGGTTRKRSKERCCEAREKRLENREDRGSSGALGLDAPAVHGVGSHLLGGGVVGWDSKLSGAGREMCQVCPKGL